MTRISIDTRGGRTYTGYVELYPDEVHEELQAGMRNGGVWLDTDDGLILVSTRNITAITIHDQEDQ